MVSTSSLLPTTTTAVTTSHRTVVNFSSPIVPRRRTPSNLRNKYPKPPIPSPSPSTPPDAHRVELTVDLPRLLSAVRRSSRDLLSSASEASRDLLTSVSVDPHGRRLVFSCRRSSLLLLWSLLLWGLAAVWAARAVAWFWGRARGWEWEGSRRVVRRDRSLGGREVVVGRGSAEWTDLPDRGRADLGGRRVLAVERREERVPDWWPMAGGRAVREVDALAQREADLLVRAITDDTMRGMDYKEDDIIQLRRICRTTGASVSFGTTNARDSFYRTAIKFVLNTCTRQSSSTAAVEFYGEDARHFIAGLAENIRLSNTRAAVILRAAVAAKARSHLLETWALDIQGKREEALEELSKICGILRIFPPDEQSPEIEMVADGLEKKLKVEQRMHLFKLFQGVCNSEESRRTVAAALGLVF